MESETRVYRTPRLSLALGTFLVVAPVLTACGFTRQVLANEALTRGLHGRDPVRLATVWVMATLLGVAGACVLTHWRNCRVVLDGRGLTTYDGRGRPDFAAQWDEVTAFGPPARASNGTWTIEAAGRAGEIGGFEPLGDLVADIVRRAPPSSLGSPHIPRAASGAPMSDRRFGYLTFRLIHALGFALADIGMMIMMVLLFLEPLFPLSVRAPGSNLLALSNEFVVAAIGSAVVFLGVVGWVLVIETLAPLIRGALSLTPGGLRHVDGMGRAVSVAWGDVRFVGECRLDDLIGSRAHLVIVGAEGVVCFGEDLSRYADARSLVLAAIPPGCPTSVLSR